MKSVITVVKEIWQKPIARIITSLLILGLLLSTLPLSELWHTLRRVTLGLWISAVVIFIGGHFAGAAKWYLLINIEKNEFPFSMVFRYYFAGLFANLFLPSVAGGDIVRAGMAIRFNSKAKEAIILGSLLDRFLDVGALALLIIAGALLSPLALGAEDARIILWIFLFLSGSVLSGILFLLIPLPQSLPKPLREVVVRVRDIIKHLIKNPQRALAGLGMAILIQGGFVIVNAILGASVGIRLTLPLWFLVWPLAKLAATLPISMGGLGVREVALAIFLGRFGVPIPNAVGLGLLWQTILVAGGGIGGAFYFLSARSIPNRKEFIGIKVPYQDNSKL